MAISLDDDGRYLTVDGRRWFVAEHQRQDADASQVVAPLGPFRMRRAVVAFESGWSASIIWGTGTYSDNHDSWSAGFDFTEDPEAVEVMVLYRHEQAHDEPLGWVSGAALNDLLEWMSSWSSRADELLEFLREHL